MRRDKSSGQDIAVQIAGNAWQKWVESITTCMTHILSTKVGASLIELSHVLDDSLHSSKTRFGDIYSLFLTLSSQLIVLSVDMLLRQLKVRNWKLIKWSTQQWGKALMKHKIFLNKSFDVTTSTSTNIQLDGDERFCACFPLLKWFREEHQVSISCGNTWNYSFWSLVKQQCGTFWLTT